MPLWCVFSVVFVHVILAALSSSFSTSRSSSFPEVEVPSILAGWGSADQVAKPTGGRSLHWCERYVSGRVGLIRQFPRSSTRVLSLSKHKKQRCVSLLGSRLKRLMDADDELVVFFWNSVPAPWNNNSNNNIINNNKHSYFRHTLLFDWLDDISVDTGTDQTKTDRMIMMTIRTTVPHQVVLRLNQTAVKRLKYLLSDLFGDNHLK